MKYRIESIGNSFSQKQISNLTGFLNQRSGEGWHFHSVFEVTDPGCMGFGSSRTYLAVFVRQG